MKSSSNPNFRGGNGDRIRFAEDQFPSISQQILQMEPVRQESGNSEQFVLDFVRSNPASEENLLVNNPTAAEIESMRQQQPEPGQPQHADISSADSHSIINRIPENSAPHPRAKKREADRRYREKKKVKIESLERESDNWKKKYEKQHEIEQQMKSTFETLKAENETLKNESVLAKEKFQTQSEELDNWKKKYEKQHETEQQMQFTFETLKAEIESLKNESVSTMHKFQTQSKELDNWKMKCEKQHENEQWMSNIKKLEAERELLRKEKELVNQKLETQSRELDKWKEESQNQLVKTRQLKFKQKILESENGRLKDQIIETQSKELVQLRNKHSAPKQPASKNSFSHGSRMAGGSCNLIGGSGQHPNLETAGCMHSSQATALPSRASSMPINGVGSSPATVIVPSSPPSPPSLDYPPSPSLDYDIVGFSGDFVERMNRIPFEPCPLDEFFQENEFQQLIEFSKIWQRRETKCIKARLESNYLSWVFQI